MPACVRDESPSHDLPPFRNKNRTNIRTNVLLRRGHAPAQQPAKHVCPRRARRTIAFCQSSPQPSSPSDEMHNCSGLSTQLLYFHEFRIRIRVRFRSWSWCPCFHLKKEEDDACWMASMQVHTGTRVLRIMPVVFIRHHDSVYRPIRAWFFCNPNILCAMRPWNTHNGEYAVSEES